jgi:hypothetical protein
VLDLQHADDFGASGNWGDFRDPIGKGNFEYR